MTVQDVNILYYDEVSGISYSLRQLRLMAFLYIPVDATETSSRSWLVSQGPRLGKTVRDVIVRLHLHDEIVKGWRMGDES